MVDHALTVLCVFWKGDFRGRPYKAEWVRRTKSMVSRHLPPHRFVCLSNVDVEGVETIPLRHNWPGWWSKLELFRSDLGIDGRCLYLDLDTLVVDDLTPLVDYPSKLAFMPPSYIVAGEPVPPCADGRHGEVINHYNSSAIVWNAGEGREIYDRFDPEAMKRFRGDQDFMGHVIDDADLLPKEWFAKLRFCTKGPRPGHKIILSMPWKCEEAARKFDWVRDIWK